MGFLFPYVSTASLLCEESIESIIGLADSEGEEPELNTGLDLSSVVDLSLESFVDLMENEKEQLACLASGHYLERLNSGGIESSWRTAAIEWFGEVRAYYNFEPLCVYLAVNYLDRFLSSNLPDEKPWAQQALSVACLSIAVKMEETLVPQCVISQLLPRWTKSLVPCLINDIKRMELFVMSSLNWRMKAVTPFSYISYFSDKFNEGKPLTRERVSRCTELILATLKATKFLRFRPSEIAAALVMYTVAETKVFDFNTALLASEIPVDKEKVRTCHEAIQKVASGETNLNRSGSLSVPRSPYGVLNASCSSFATDDSQTPRSSEAGNNNNATGYQTCSPFSKRARLDQAKMA